MALPAVSDLRLTDRRSFPEWYAELRINATFRNIWQFVDPSAPRAPHLPSSAPVAPPTIDAMISRLGEERGLPLKLWMADERPVVEKGAQPMAPRAARFDDIKEEYSFRLKEYAVKHSNWSAQSASYHNIWDWVRRTVEPTLLQPHLELLVSQQELTLQNVVRALRDKFQPSEDNTREEVRETYRRIMERGKLGSQSPQIWLNDWFQALARAQTYRVAEVEGFLAIKDFLNTVSMRLAPGWGAQQLATVIEANALSEPVRTLEEYGKILEALIQHNESSTQRSHPVFATLGGRSDGYCCPCKESRAERHPWPPVECSIVELAVRGTSDRRPDPYPSDEQLKAVRERLSWKQYDKIRGQLESKWSRDKPTKISA